MASSRSGDIKKAEKILQGARLGDLRMVKVCAKSLDRGKGIKATIASVKDSNGEGAIHLAAREGKTEILQYLIENLGFNPDLPPSSSSRKEAPHGYKLYSDKTPLLCATLGGHVDTIEYLIKKGADLNARDENGFTPIHTAVFESQVQSLFTLASKGAPVDGLHFIGTPLLLAAARNNPNMVKILLDHKADPEMKYKEMIYKDYITPLVISVLNGSKECSELLVKAGANVNRPPVLEMAIGSKDLLSYLLKAGANPNFRNEFGRVPIEMAAIRGEREAVEILFPLTSPIETVKDWSIEGLFNHVQSQSFKNEEKVRHEKKMKKLKYRIEDAIERQGFIAARYFCFYALQEDPMDPMVLANRTLCKMKIEKDITNGLVEIQESKSAQACLCLADILRAMGNHGAAGLVLIGAMSFEPENDEIMKSLKGLDCVRVVPKNSAE